MKQILPLLFSVLFAAASAQTKIGKVFGSIKAGDNAVDGATVFLLKQKDSSVVKAAVSDKVGKFEMNKIPAGKYFISVTASGYQKFRTSPFSIDSSTTLINFSELSLSPAIINLNNVTVVAQPPFIERKIDRLVLNVASSPLNAGASAFEILERSPGVTIDENDNISLSGKAGVMIFIDGKPSYLAGRDLTNYLRALPVTQLDQLEIMTHPPARYDAAGDAGIINFKTKKNHANGFNGSINAAAIFSYHFKTRNSLILNWKKNKFNVSANYSYADLKNYVNQHIQRNFRSNRQSNFNRYLDQDARLVWSQYPHNLKLAMDYAMTEKTTLGLVVSGNFSGNYQSIRGAINISDSFHNPVQYTNYITSVKNTVSNPAINLNFQKKLGKGKELTADADYVYYRNQGEQSSFNYVFDKNGTPLDPVLLQNSSPLQIDIYSVKSDYSQSLPGNSKLEAGIKFSTVKTDDDAHYHLYNKQQDQWQVDSNRTNHFIYQESINAAYISINKQFNKKWGMQAGLRLEQTNGKGDERVKASEFKRNYAHLFPTLYINYVPDDKNNFKLAYARRINRPNYQFLNPFQSVIDQFTFSQGNPFLRPITTDNIELCYSYGGQVDLLLNYTITHDIFSPLLQTVKQGNNFVTLQMPVNVSRRRSMGIDVNYHKSVTKWWTTNTDVHVLNNHFDDVLDSARVVADVVVCIASMTNQFPLKKGWTFDLSGSYRTRRLEGFPVYAISSGVFSVGVSKKIRTRATITMSLNDPFGLSRGGIRTDRETFTFQTLNHIENRYLTLNISYRFGKTMQTKNRKTGGAQDELNRL
jgi:outer membrane beta-barrel protein/carboxypeptidase family protein